MIDANVEVINALVAEKRHKPLIIEGVVIGLPHRQSTWRKQCVAIWLRLADILESLRLPILKTVRGNWAETPEPLLNKEN